MTVVAATKYVALDDMRVLAEAGASLCLVDVNEAGLAETAAMIADPAVSKGGRPARPPRA